MRSSTPTTSASATSRALPILSPSPEREGRGPFEKLDDLRIASPCTTSWDDMVGSERVRFCGSCQKNVYHLSGMKRDEALDLLRAAEGSVCVRFFRRADGTVLTEDCPVGVERIVRRAKRATRAAAALSIGALAVVLAALGGAFTRRTCEGLVRTAQAIEAPLPEAAPPDFLATMGEPMMGDVANPPEPPRELQELTGRIAGRL